MNNIDTYEKNAKDNTEICIKDISNFLCKMRINVERLKYNFDKLDYDEGIIYDLEDGLLKLGLSLADLLRYWDDEND